MGQKEPFPAGKLSGREGPFSVVDYLARAPNDPIMNLASLAELIGPSPPRCRLNPAILCDVCGRRCLMRVEEVEFAQDSALEEAGFELSVPRPASLAGVGSHSRRLILISLPGNQAEPTSAHTNPSTGRDRGL